MTSCGRHGEYLHREPQTQNDRGAALRKLRLQADNNRRFDAQLMTALLPKNLPWHACAHHASSGVIACWTPAAATFAKDMAPHESPATSRLRYDAKTLMKVCLQLVVEPYGRLPCSPASCGDGCGEDPCREAIDIISMSVSNHSILLCGVCFQWRPGSCAPKLLVCHPQDMVLRILYVGDILLSGTGTTRPGTDLMVRTVQGGSSGNRVDIGKETTITQRPEQMRSARCRGRSTSFEIERVQGSPTRILKVVRQSAVPFSSLGVPKVTYSEPKAECASASRRNGRCAVPSLASSGDRFRKPTFQVLGKSVCGVGSTPPSPRKK